MVPPQPGKDVFLFLFFSKSVPLCRSNLFTRSCNSVNSGVLRELYSQEFVLRCSLPEKEIITKSKKLSECKQNSMHNVYLDLLSANFAKLSLSKSKMHCICQVTFQSSGFDVTFKFRCNFLLQFTLVNRKMGEILRKLLFTHLFCSKTTTTLIIIDKLIRHYLNVQQFCKETSNFQKCTPFLPYFIQHSL